MGWRPRLLLNENKCSTWARLCSHVSLPQAKSLWVLCLKMSPKHPTPQMELPTAAEDSPARSDPFTQTHQPRSPRCFLDSLEVG